jgi:YgiT-type zinc finger domain
MNCICCKGDMTESITTHVVDINNCLTIIRNVPCLKCTQCGEAVYTDEVAEQLEIIVKACLTSITEIAVVNYSDKIVA